MTILLRVAYDGTGFHGYAAQTPLPGDDALRTVQATLENALGRMYRGAVPTRAASRTDAGVHALGQLVAFEPPFDIPREGMLRGLNALLPADVVCLAAWDSPAGTDVRHDNLGKHYRYRIRSTEVAHPIRCREEWHLRKRLDLEAMRAAALRFAGTHDFGSFRAASCQAKTSVRTVDEVQVLGRDADVGPPGDPGRLVGPRPHGPDVIEVHVRGRGFLHKMVRIMVGTLVETGLNRRDPAEIDRLLATPNRARAGATAPARGLTLVEVVWPHASPEGRP